MTPCVWANGNISGGTKNGSQLGQRGNKIEKIEKIEKEETNREKLRGESPTEALTAISPEHVFGSIFLIVLLHSAVDSVRTGSGYGMIPSGAVCRDIRCWTKQEICLG